MRGRNPGSRIRNHGPDAGRFLTLWAVFFAAGVVQARDASAPTRMFDPSGLGLIRTIAPGGDPYGIAFTSDGRRLAVGFGNGAAVYETEHWREVRRLEGHPNVVLALAWSPDGNFLAAGGFEGKVVLWDARTGAVHKTLEGHSTYVGALAWSPDGKSLVTGAHDGTVKVSDPETGMERPGIGNRSGGPVMSVAFSRDGSRAVFGLGTGEARVWKAGSWTEERTIAIRGGGNVLSVGFTRDGTRVAAATEAALTVTGIAAGTGESRFEIPTAGLSCLRLSPDDRYAIAAGNDMILRVHDLLRRGEAVATLRHHTGQLSGVAVRPDGRFVATIGHDRHLKIWGRVAGGMARVRPKGFCGIRVQADAAGRIVIADVIAGTAAQAAGMQVGDALRSVGGVEVHNTTESVDRIGSYLEGDEVEFGIERAGESRVLKFKLGRRPDDLEN